MVQYSTVSNSKYRFRTAVQVKNETIGPHIGKKRCISESSIKCIQNRIPYVDPPG
jgi:hypothetical protein